MHRYFEEQGPKKKKLPTVEGLLKLTLAVQVGAEEGTLVYVLVPERAM